MGCKIQILESYSSLCHLFGAMYALIILIQTNYIQCIGYNMYNNNLL